MRKTQAAPRAFFTHCKRSGIALAGFYCTAYLFGAPLLSVRTALFAIDQLILTYLPLCLACQHDLAQFWQCVDNRPFTLQQLYVSRIALGSVLGAWLGAAVIPLDWDCWWQVWPLCSHFGSLFGILFASLSAFFRIWTSPPFARTSKRKPSSIAPYQSEPLVQFRRHQQRHRLKHC